MSYGAIRPTAGPSRPLPSPSSSPSPTRGPPHGLMPAQRSYGPAPQGPNATGPLGPYAPQGPFVPGSQGYGAGPQEPYASVPQGYGPPGSYAPQQGQGPPLLSSAQLGFGHSQGGYGPQRPGYMPQGQAGYGPSPSAYGHGPQVSQFSPSPYATRAPSAYSGLNSADYSSPSAMVPGLSSAYPPLPPGQDAPSVNDPSLYSSFPIDTPESDRAANGPADLTCGMCQVSVRNKKGGEREGKVRKIGVEMENMEITKGDND